VQRGAQSKGRCRNFAVDSQAAKGATNLPEKSSRWEESVFANGKGEALFDGAGSRREGIT